MNNLEIVGNSRSMMPWHSRHPACDIILRPGLNLHFGDTTDGDNRVLRGEVQDRFRLIVVLEGLLDIGFGSKRLKLGEQENVALVSLQTYETFTRYSVKGRYCKRISIGVSMEWLQQSFTTFEQKAWLSRRWRHLDIVRWRASSEELTLANELICPPDSSPMLKGLARESRTIALLLNGFNRVPEKALQSLPGSSIKQTVPANWLAFRDWLETHATEPLCLQDLSVHMNTTPSTLQRKFKTYFNETVFEFIQSCRLQISMKKLLTSNDSITCIAHDVGYSGSASFCTAFKNHFGITPKKARTH